MPYGVTCKFVVLQLQPVDKDEMLRIADNVQVKKPEYPVYVVYQKLVTSVTSWYDFILSNTHYIVAKNLLRYGLLRDYMRTENSTKFFFSLNLSFHKTCK